MFEVNQKIVYHTLPHKRLFYVKAVLEDSIVVRECWDEAGAKSFSEFPPYSDIRHATQEEIAVGHRIKKPIQSFDEFFEHVEQKNIGPVDAEVFAKALMICDAVNVNACEILEHPEDYTSPNCKKYER